MINKRLNRYNKDSNLITIAIVSIAIVAVLFFGFVLGFHVGQTLNPL